MQRIEETQANSAIAEKNMCS